MTGSADDVPPELLAPVRAACLELPETSEEPAWIGVRWRIRKRTFAHLYRVHPEETTVYARAAATQWPATVLTFRSSGQELATMTAAGPPYFRPGWGTDVVGLVLGEEFDPAELEELVTESYCLLAPKKLAALIERPSLDSGRG